MRCVVSMTNTEHPLYRLRFPLESIFGPVAEISEQFSLKRKKCMRRQKKKCRIFHSTDSFAIF